LQSATSYADVQKTLITPGLTWEDLKRLRERWKGRLLVKGILHAQDAVACAELGCDGIVVSNHGGRQVAFGPPTIEALPAIAKAVAGRMTIILDSGIRRGADILRAKALGPTLPLLAARSPMVLALAAMQAPSARLTFCNWNWSAPWGNLASRRISPLDVLNSAITKKNRLRAICLSSFIVHEFKASQRSLSRGTLSEAVRCTSL